MEVQINIDVPDLERAIRFYREALGLQPQRRLFAGTVAELHGASSTIYLLANAEGSSPFPLSTATRNYRRHWTPVHIDFVVDDLEKALERAQQAGAAIETGPQSYPWGRLATLSDPFGNGFCLLQWSGHGYDEAD